MTAEYALQVATKRKKNEYMEYADFQKKGDWIIARNVNNKLKRIWKPKDILTLPTFVETHTKNGDTQWYEIDEKGIHTHISPPIELLN